MFQRSKTVIFLYTIIINLGRDNSRSEIIKNRHHTILNDNNGFVVLKKHYISAIRNKSHKLKK